jgi:hypothetical protein
MSRMPKAFWTRSPFMSDEAAHRLAGRRRERCHRVQQNNAGSRPTTAEAEQEGPSIGSRVSAEKNTAT